VRRANSPKGRRQRRSTMSALLLAAVAVAAASVVGVEVSTGNGYAPWQDQASTLARSVGLGSVFDSIANWAYSLDGPGNGQPDVQALGTTLSGTPIAAVAAQRLGLPALTNPSGDVGWREVGGTAGGKPSVYTTFVEPDSSHRSVVVAVALMRSSLLKAHLVAGTVQPVRSHGQARISNGDIPNLVTAFNSGLKMSAHPGGFYLNGKPLIPLIAGKASAVVDDAGHLTIGEWGRDARMTSHVIAVRQNLALIVAQGQAVAGLDRNVGNRWGSARSQSQYTWRSGLGTTAAGDVVYVVGDKLNLTTLAAALVDAGAKTGMELDVRREAQAFTVWTSDPSGRTRVPHKLMTTIGGPIDRYVSPDARDFFFFSSTTSPSN
jgi:hypothetical protein